MTSAGADARVDARRRLVGRVRLLAHLHVQHGERRRHLGAADGLAAPRDARRRRSSARRRGSATTRELRAGSRSAHDLGHRPRADMGAAPCRRVASAFAGGGRLVRMAAAKTAPATSSDLAARPAGAGARAAPGPSSGRSPQAFSRGFVRSRLTAREQHRAAPAARSWRSAPARTRSATATRASAGAGSRRPCRPRSGRSPRRTPCWRNAARRRRARRRAASAGRLAPEHEQPDQPADPDRAGGEVDPVERDGQPARRRLRRRGPPRPGRAASRRPPRARRRTASSSATDRRSRSGRSTQSASAGRRRRTARTQSSRSRKPRPNAEARISGTMRAEVERGAQRELRRRQVDVDGDRDERDAPTRSTKAIVTARSRVPATRRMTGRAIAIRSTNSPIAAITARNDDPARGDEPRRRRRLRDRRDRRTAAQAPGSARRRT